MKNVNLRSEGSAFNHPLKKLGEKIVPKVQGADLPVKNFNVESQAITRLGVIIDWANGTMRLQAP